MNALERWLSAFEREGTPAHALAACLLFILIGSIADRMNALLFSRAMTRALATSAGEVITRLVLIRRLVRAALWALVGALCAAQFDTLRTLGATLLASAGVVGVVMGVAARSTFANLIAGMQIAFTQPVRVGDQVTIRDETGDVEDITLTYTFIRTGDGRRLAIPNDVLSNEIIKNHSLRDPRILAVAQFSVGYGADLDQVRALLLEAASACPAWDKKEPPSCGVSELTDQGYRLKAAAWASNPKLASELATQLRERGLQALQKAQVAFPQARP